MTKNSIIQEYNKFFTDLKNRVASSRYQAAFSVNKELIMLYIILVRKYLKHNPSKAGEPRLSTNYQEIYALSSLT
jgi:hypothetical protein